MRPDTDTAASVVLHALVLKGMARADALAAATANAPDDVLRELDRLRTEGLASHHERRGLWNITAAGRARHAKRLAGDLPADARDRLDGGYRRFLPVNHRFKQTCTRWQLRAGVPNDHADADYDRGVVGELVEVHEQAQQLIAEWALVRARFERYATRLAGALARLRAGDRKAFTGVQCESYHDIWMELHRDLLLSLQRDREAEERTVS